jgi:hypothetical protein
VADGGRARSVDGGGLCRQWAAHAGKGTSGCVRGEVAGCNTRCVFLRVMRRA